MSPQQQIRNDLAVIREAEIKIVKALAGQQRVSSPASSMEVAHNFANMAKAMASMANTVALIGVRFADLKFPENQQGSTTDEKPEEFPKE